MDTGHSDTAGPARRPTALWPAAARSPQPPSVRLPNRAAAVLADMDGFYRRPPATAAQS